MADDRTQEADEFVLSPSDALATMDRLIAALQFAKTAATSELVGRIWTVNGNTNGGRPDVKGFDDYNSLFAYVTELRAQQNADRETEYYLHIFYGQRWGIQKGRTWQLWDGKVFTPIVSGQVEEFLDDSGSLLDTHSLDTLELPPPETEEVEEPEEETDSDVLHGDAMDDEDGIPA